MLVNLMSQKDNVELQINLTISVDNVNNTLICVCSVVCSQSQTKSMFMKIKCEATYLSIMHAGNDWYYVF